MLIDDVIEEVVKNNVLLHLPRALVKVLVVTSNLV